MPAIDHEIYRELFSSTGEDPHFMHELISVYLADAPQLIEQMIKSYDSDDLEGFRRAAHSLKSTSANVGALNLSALARELEMLARTGVLEGLSQRLGSVEEEFSRVKAEMTDLDRTNT